MGGASSDDPLFADWDIETDRSLGSYRPRTGPRRDHSAATAAFRGLAADFDSPGDPAPGADRSESGSTRNWTAGQTDGSSAPSAVVLPRPGDEVGGFRLIAELGRGAFARVFLAEEASLGGRPVALKVSEAEGDEPQILARLQHAHIVPLHSVRDDPETGLRLLCMPYLGGANLAQLMDEARARSESGGGQNLVEALDVLSRRFTQADPPGSLARRSLLHRTKSGDEVSLRVDPPESAGRPASGHRTSLDRPSRRFAPLRWILERPDPVGEAAEAESADELLPSRRFLRRADRVRAAVWVVARLAEGLEHAHSRGLLHRDLKPSNVLIAADGTPMLLDFNLSVEAPTGGGDAESSIAKAMLGGTLPYMAPEHLDALDPQGATPASAVDERSDLYALGLILFEMIAGESPFTAPEPTSSSLPVLRRMLDERRRPAPSLRARVPAVPPSLDALVAKCLDPNPTGRHATAGELAEDLRRFLDDLPMKHGPEPSLSERLRKWARRHPAACSSTSTAAGAVLVVGMVVALSFQVYSAAEGLYVRLKLRKFQHDALECRFLLNTTDDAARVHRGLQLASATLAAAGVDEAKGNYGGGWIDELESSERREIRRSIVDLVLQDANARVVTTAGQAASRRREALESAVRRLDRLAGSLPSPPSILFRQRSMYRAALGDARGAEADRAEAASRPPTSCHDWTALGMFQLSSGDVSAAELSLREAVALDVTSFWAWFALGHCHYEQSRFAEAAGDFTACVVARPDFAWGHFNRGLALSRAGRLREALDAYSRALTIDPDFVEARVDRGLVELGLDMPDRAEADLRAGISSGRRDPRLTAALGDAMARQGKADQAEALFDDLLARSPGPDLRAARGIVRLRTDPEGAAKDFEAALAEEPRHAVAHYGLARLLEERSPDEALAHLDQSIRSEPDLFDSVELRAILRARKHDRAALDDVDRLTANPTANRLYNAGCALALLREGDRAVELVGRAVLAGFPPSHAAGDPDLASVRGRADFKAALERPAVSR